ncbi:hypothetical protein JXE04_01890 [Patescibacteria group bacterium]|nr:hypothetical protein [Patescibacteria group bacterium]
MKKIFHYTIKFILFLFLIAVLFLASGFFAVRWGLTNVAGEEDGNSFAYNLIAEEKPIEQWISPGLPENLSIYGENEYLNWCRLGVATELSPYDAKGMFEAYTYTKSSALLDRMILALSLRQGQDSIFNELLNDCKNEPSIWNEDSLKLALMEVEAKSVYTWQNGEPWQIIKEAIIKDESLIKEVSKITSIQPRLLVSVAIVEQLRLYYTQREFYEQFFKPLKILANANKMAWGVMSIKEKMAIETEAHLHDKKSEFYLGPEYENLLNYTSTDNIAKERYDRLTNEKNHYYSYLYGALIIKQLQEQWLKHKYDLTYRPEIIATLFNIGFNNSEPKANPSVGGSTLEIEGEKYFFGSLAFEFYYSGELSETFPFD